MKRNMIKQKCWIGATFILLSCLTACENHVADNNTLNDGTIEEAEITKTESEDIEGSVSIEQDTIEGSKTQDLDIERDSMIEAYTSILQELYTNHTFPDGGADYGFSDDYDISENQFAVYDIDQDGKDELIIEYTTTAMAGMVEKIYDFNSSTNAVTEEFTEWPNLTYYDNGVIEAGWSHNQGLAGEFWPYTLYQYDQESDTYIEVGMVDAWDKSLSETNYDGKLFPYDIDKDGDGIVYYIMLDGEYELDKPVDLEEYNRWHDSYVGDTKKVDVPFVKLNEENIYSIK